MSKAKETLVEAIYKNIRKDIITQYLTPGQRIFVADLAERYGTSETPVKLALNRLISDRIIVNYPRKGMKIYTLDPNEVSEIFDIRIMMELYYTKEIIDAVNVNKRLKEELLKNVEEHHALVTGDIIDSDDFEKNYNYDYEFHKLYLKSSGNSKLVELYKSANPFIYFNYLFRRQSKEKDITGVIEHRQILDAILNKDEEQLKKNIKLHLENGKQAVSLILKVDQMF